MATPPGPQVVNQNGPSAQPIPTNDMPQSFEPSAAPAPTVAHDEMEFKIQRDNSTSSEPTNTQQEILDEGEQF